MYFLPDRICTWLPLDRIRPSICLIKIYPSPLVCMRVRKEWSTPALIYLENWFSATFSKYVHAINVEHHQLHASSHAYREKMLHFPPFQAWGLSWQLSTRLQPSNFLENQNFKCHHTRYSEKLNAAKEMKYLKAKTNSHAGCCLLYLLLFTTFRTGLGTIQQVATKCCYWWILGWYGASCQSEPDFLTII